MDVFSDSGESSSGSSPGRLDIVEKYSDDGRSEAGEEGLTINEEFAKRFQHNRARDELQRLEEKYGRRRAAEMLAKSHRGEDESDSADDTDSTDETEDEDGEQITADVDAAILSTLAKIQRKDESIYEAGKRVFDEERKVASSSQLMPRSLGRSASGKDKVTLKSYQRARIQELMEKSADPAKALADAQAVQPKRGPYGYQGDSDMDAHLPYNEQQEKLRRDVVQAFQNAKDSDDDEDDFLESRNSGGDAETGGEASTYREYLLNAIGGEEDQLRNILTTQSDEAAAESSGAPQSEATSKAKSTKSKKAKAEEDNDFLVNYVLNRGWVDNPSAAPKFSSNGGEGDDGGVESDDSFDSKADAFETAYNFRFQELEEGETNPQIQSYARQIEGSVRRKEEKRKREREERAKRKQAEKEEKKRQLDALRDAKRKSIVDKLKALREATGSTAVDFEGLDLEGDFDPEEHDRLMAQAFNEDYYGEDDDQKPTWSDDGSDVEDILREQEAYDAEHGEIAASSKSKKKDKKSKKDKAKGADDDRIEMDADFIDEGGNADSQTGKKLTKAEKKKLKKRERAKAKKAEEAGEAGVQGDTRGDGVAEDEMDADVKADVEELKGLEPRQRKQKVDEMLDEYYGLEYEDVIGDQPTRFKYTQVPKSDFGMTAEEILMADDAELNKIVSLKRLQPYRRGRTKPADLNSRLKDFRRKLSRQNESASANDGDQQQQSKRPGKRERERKAKAKELAAAQQGQDSEDAPQTTPAVNGKDATQSKKSKKRKSEDTETPNGAGPNAATSSSDSKKKHKRDKQHASVAA